MGNTIKCYLAFTTMAYRIVAFAVLPLVAVVSVLLFGADFIYMEIILLLAAEIMMDGLSFGGIAAREVGLPEYVKASGRGQSVMRKVLVGNLIRQFAESAALILASLCIVAVSENGILKPDRGDLIGVDKAQLAAMFLLGYVLMVLGVTVARFFEMMWTGMLVATFAEFLFLAGMISVVVAPVLMTAVLIPVAAVVSIAATRVLEKRMERSYYD